MKIQKRVCNLNLRYACNKDILGPSFWPVVIFGAVIEGPDPTSLHNSDKA